MKLLFYKRIKQKVSRNDFLTMEEKRELALKGEDVPLCISDSKKIRYSFGVALEKRFIPGRTKDAKKLRLKI